MVMADTDKPRLRHEATARRKQAHAMAQDAAMALRDRFLDGVPLDKGWVVSGYWPMGEEIDPRPLMEALVERGHPCCLPVTLERGLPLLFRAWTPETELQPAGFGTRVPPDEAPQLEPDLLIVPLLAFDPDGYRLGYGGGYYDVTLAALRRHKRIVAAGVAYALQEVEALPREPHDQPLDWIVTERAARRLVGSAP